MTAKKAAAAAPVVPPPGPLLQFFRDLTRPGKIRKFLIGCAALASSLLAANLVPEPVDQYVSAGLAFLGAIGIYTVTNSSDEDRDGDTGSTLADVLIFALIVLVVLVIVARFV